MMDIDCLDWAKGDGLLPAVVQDSTGRVRMLGYMNREALEHTIATGDVTFFSRSRGRLWIKGKTSGNRLRLVSIAADCDNDTLLVQAVPEGPTCHTGADSCFDEDRPFFPAGLERTLQARVSADPDESYTARLLAEGLPRLAQKVGEEGVEVALAAVTGGRDALVSEAADLAYHLTLLLQASDLGWADVAAELERRHRDRTATA